jgi:hypothetical protein
MNENQGKVLAWHCLTQKKDPFQFKREFHILEDGQITKRADAMAADFIRRGGKIKWLSDLNDGDEAKAEFKNRDGDTYVWSFSFKDAEGYAYGREGIKRNWKASKPDMLRARLLSKSIRILDPEVNAGVYTPEELRDNEISQVAPSSTGLFDRPPVASTAQTTNEGVSAPVQTVAEVVNTAPAQAKEAAQPAQTTLPLQAAAPVSPAPAKPTEKTREEMLKVFENKFKDIPSPQVDAFFVQKTWLKPGQCLIELSDDYMKRLFKTINQIVPLCKAWIMQKEKARIAKEAKEGGAK